MSLLFRNSLPAERQRGCIFAENFDSADAVRMNDGSITGSIDFNQQGADFDGTNDYITYSTSGLLTNVSNFSCVIEFIPDFDYDDNAQYVFFDSTLNHRFLLYKATDNRIYLYLGNVAMGSVVSGTYGPYWRKGQVNRMVIVSTTGDTNMWLNCQKIMDGYANAWTAKDPDNLYVGAGNVGGDKFNGKISQLKIFNVQLTDQEAEDYYNNSTFNYQNKAILNLKMGLAEHDPTNVRTLDRSGKGYYATFGDGATSSTYPTKLSGQHGYSLDGTDDYFEGSLSETIDSSKGISFVLEFSPDFDYDVDAFVRLFDVESNKLYIQKRDNANNNTLRIVCGDAVIANIASASYSPYWKKGQRNVLVVSAKTEDTSAWLNGNEILSNDPDAWTGAAVTVYTIGSTAGGAGQFFDGKHYRAEIYPFALTPMQEIDTRHRILREVNDL